MIRLLSVVLAQRLVVAGVRTRDALDVMSRFDL